MMTDTEALTGFLTARSSIYRLFSDLYYGMVDAELYERLQTVTPHIAEMAEVMDDKRLSEAACRLAVKMKEEEAGEELYSKMRQAFTRLYLLGKNSLSLHESVWLSQAKEVKKEPYFLIRAYYKAFQFKRSLKSKESDESLTVMLLFMSAMSKEAAVKVEKGDFQLAEKFLEAQKRFLEDHLLKWVFELCEDSAELAGRVNLALYGEIAALFHAFMSFDKMMVEEFLSALS